MLKQKQCTILLFFGFLFAIFLRDQKEMSIVFTSKGWFELCFNLLLGLKIICKSFKSFSKNNYKKSSFN